MDKHQEEGMKQHLLLMCGLASRQQQQLSTLRSTVSRVSLNYSGTFLWRINDVQTKIAEARIKEGFELISAPFYTSQYGYKLQVCPSSSLNLLFKKERKIHYIVFLTFIWKHSCD